MVSLIKLLEEIEERPAMFLGRSSVFTLDAFLGGVGWNRTEIQDFDVLWKFEEWIINKFNIKTSHGWASIIYFYSAHELDSLNNFFILFKEFKEANKIK
jgi:hypothetical protein